MRMGLTPMYQDRVADHISFEDLARARSCETPIALRLRERSEVRVVVQEIAPEKVCPMTGQPAKITGYLPEVPGYPWFTITSAGGEHIFSCYHKEDSD